MKKRLTACLLVLAMLIPMMPAALAASASDMTDISGHWAEQSIREVMERGLFAGTSDTTFEPNLPMSRAMFVTLLGRIAGINPEDYNTWYAGNLFTDVPGGMWYTPYICWACRYGITSGVGDGSFRPNEIVTREQMATFIVRFTSIYNYDLVGVPTQYTFDDVASISPFAVSSVEMLRQVGLFSGIVNDNGGYDFAPQQSATRAEGAAMTIRVLNAMQPSSRTVVKPNGISLNTTAQTVYVGDTVNLYATISPSNATNQAVTWFSTKPSVASVIGGVVTAKAVGTADIYCMTWNGYWNKCTVTVQEPVPLAYEGESYSDKLRRIFGTTNVSDPRLYYSNDSSARQDMVSISVQVWDFADSSRTTKKTRTLWVAVHKNIAATVKAIFADIYNSSEKPPIYEMGGYRWEYKSEHNAGLAIDLNANSNYYCDPSGRGVVGDHWSPATDPYSIPIDGVIENTFRKYGFTRGIYWRSGYKDYMHFSFFGT